MDTNAIHDPIGEAPATAADLIRSVERAMAGLAADLKSAATAAEKGELPGDELSAHLGRVREQFARTHEALDAMAERLGLELGPRARPFSVARVKSDASAIDEAASRRSVRIEGLSRVRHALDRVVRLVHRDRDPFEPLEACRQEAARLQDAIDTAAEESRAELADIVDQFDSGRHPLAALLTLVRSAMEDGAPGSDDALVAADDVVRARFGPALALAAVRGLLTERLDADAASEPDTGADAPAPSLSSDQTASEGEREAAGGGTPAGEAQPAAPTGAPAAGSESPSAVASPLPVVSGDPSQVAVVPAGGAAVASAEGEVPETASAPVGAHDDASSDTGAAGVPAAEGNRAPLRRLPRFEDCDSRRLAARLVESGALDEPSGVQALVWHLVAEGRDPLAFHLALASEQRFVGQSPMFPAWVAAALALTPHLRQSNGDVAIALRERFAAFDDANFSGADEDWNHGLRFLMAASAAPVALLAPDAGASAILHRLWFQNLPKTYEYCDVIATYGDKRNPLDPRALTSVQDLASWQAECDRLRREADAWLQQQRGAQLLFTGATRVLRALCAKGGHIDGLIDPIRRGDASMLPQVAKLAGWLSNPAEQRREIQRIDRMARVSGQVITARALTQLTSRISDALTFARRWCGLMEAAPQTRPGYLVKSAEGLRDALRPLQRPLLQELAAFADANGDAFARVGVARLRQAVERIGRLFDGEEVSLPAEPVPGSLLNEVVLGAPEFEVDVHWEPRLPGQGRQLPSLVTLAARGPLEPSQVVDARCEARDFAGARVFIDALRGRGEAPESVHDLSAKVDEQLELARRDLEAEARRAEQEVENALRFGIIDEAQRTALAARVVDLHGRVQRAENLRPVAEGLKDVAQEVQRLRAERVDGLKVEMDAAGIAPGHPAHARIEESRTRGDILTAREYVDCVRDGRPLPDPLVEREVFDEFFPAAAREVAELLEKTSAVELVDCFMEGRDVAHLGLDHPDLDNVSAGHLVKRWFETKRERRFEKLSLRSVLTEFGFSVKAELGRLGTTSRAARFEFRTDPIADRSRCPVPEFGSSAGGHYRLLCINQLLNDEDIVSEVGPTQGEPPVIVFFFNRLSEVRRRDLARRCRELRRRFIVVDDILAVYLAAQRGARLPVLFDCTLPFTTASPYSSTAGLVPPEMFYGRRREQEAIVDRNGTNFIFGGRQLGKTALLRHTAASFSQPREGRHAILVDLKGEGIGYQRPVGDVWAVIAAEFKRAGILPPSYALHFDDVRLADHVRSWMEKDERRRILLLLDEADRFLFLDEQEEFTRTARLKALMDATARRFKVVFAGLHNVQRATTKANHPLAHLNAPVCIGPLLGDSEWREARQLVERPFRALGYRFEHPDLVTRVLAQTNYYPSLIQIYCSELLKHVSDPHGARFDGQCPPWHITERHLDAAYHSQELFKQVRDRFLWTLQLDQRYEVIAYALALECAARPEALVQGVSVGWVRDEAVPWWKEGFASSSSESSLWGLLEEMVGLGVLRPLPSGRFTLRNPNVLSLMGSETEVARALEAKREVPDEFEVATLRAPLKSSDEVVPVRRSPLTTEQLHDLRRADNSVSIVFGTAASGMGDVLASLAMPPNEEFVELAGALQDIASFDRALSARFRRRKEGTSLLVVPPAAAWTGEWVAEARRRLRELVRTREFVRVVFLADAAKTWQLVLTEPDELASWESEGLTMQLEPWRDGAIRRWLEDCNFGPHDSEGRAQIAEVTGGWSGLLYRFRELAASRPDRWRECLDELRLASVTSDKRRYLSEFGLDDAAESSARVLASLAILGPATLEELTTVTEIPSESLRPHLRWSARLGLTRLAPGGHWEMDPVVATLLLPEPR